ncbi:MAG TPA: nucleoside deaminase [Candidatus Microsaccharimonas sp.]|nr:nucleoside deaminase [Candidatus Microsaccharimonas sp.]
MTDQDFLRRAVEVGNTVSEPYNFGAVIVKDGEIIAEDTNHVHELTDPTAHAETSAIKAACQKLGTYNLEGCIMYGSHEPCLMCFSCAAWARMDRVVYAQAATDTNFTYEFDLTLAEIAAKQTSRNRVKVEYIPLTA